MSIRHLRKKIDSELVERVLEGRAGILEPSKPVKRVKPSRPAHSYRAARRNRVLRVEKRPWRGIPSKYFPPAPVRPNKRVTQEVSDARGLDQAAE